MKESKLACNLHVEYIV